MHINFSILNHFSDFRRGGCIFDPLPTIQASMPWGPISLREFVESMDFHGTHGISWNPRLFMVSTKFSWNPRSFHGIHEVSMDSTKFSWSPRSFHGLHEVFMESTKFSWIPRNFHGIHEGRGIHENSPWNFHEVRGIHGKANWIVPLIAYHNVSWSRNKC